MTEEELMEIARPFAADGGRWPSDWLAAMKAAVSAEREACAMMLDEEADRQERAWNEHLASGKGGPATSYHAIPRGYAARIRARSNNQGKRPAESGSA